MATTPRLITEPRVIQEAAEMIWRTDTRQAAREAGVAPEDINRHVFWAWRIRAAGGAQAVVYGLGPTRGPRRSGGHG